MADYPEVIFHRYFQGLGPADRALYRGKADLVASLEKHSRLPVPLLESLQDMFNGALSHAKPVEAHAEHGKFHCDYVDSDDPNAMAFADKGYAFIGITIALVNLLAELANRLSTHQPLISALRLPKTIRVEGLYGFILRHQLMFVLGHEWSHHVQGTIPKGGSDSRFANEVHGLGKGDMLLQAYECAADGYAAFHSLTNITEDPTERQSCVGLLGLEGQSEANQDQALVFCFLASIVAFFYAQEPHVISEANARSFVHPPQVFRANQLLGFFQLWASQRRPAMAAFEFRAFAPIFRGVASGVWGVNGASSWDQQVRFLTSEAGNEYALQLTALVDAHMRATWRR